MSIRRTVIVIIAAVALGAVAFRFGQSGSNGGESTGRIVLAEAAVVSELATDRYAKALGDYVSDDGLVNYEGLKANPEDLNAYLTSVANLDPKVFEGWSESERIAVLCNTYNAYTLKAIIDHYPIKASFIRGLAYPKNSIRQISGVWDKLSWPVMGKKVTLNTIEHKRLRAQFNEPRVHAALVCAAMSCPPLRNKPYAGDRLNEQLNEQMTDYLGNQNRFRIDRGENVVYLSSILKWYGEDFLKSYSADKGFGGRGPVERAVLNAAAPHISDADAEYLRTAKYAVKYLDYDWSLNEQ